MFRRANIRTNTLMDGVVQLLSTCSFLPTACYDEKVLCWNMSECTTGGYSLTKLNEITSFTMLVLCMQVCVCVCQCCFRNIFRGGGGANQYLRNRGGCRLQLKCIKLKLAKAQTGKTIWGGGGMPPSTPLKKTGVCVCVPQVDGDLLYCGSADMTLKAFNISVSGGSLRVACIIHVCVYVYYFL